MSSNDLDLSPKSKQIQIMFDKISARYNFLNRLLSFGQDIRWRNTMLKKIPFIQNKEGVLYDVATGTGDVIYSFVTKRVDYNKIIGFDISEGMLQQAKIKNKHKNIQFIHASAEHLPEKNESADCITIAFGLRNVDNREKALQEFYRVLKNKGCLMILEFFPAKSSIFQILFNFYFKKILPKVGGFFSDKSAYTYLPTSVESMPTASEFKSMLIKNGFTNVESRGWLSGSTMLFICSK